MRGGLRVQDEGGSSGFRMRGVLRVQDEGLRVQDEGGPQGSQGAVF